MHYERGIGQGHCPNADHPFRRVVAAKASIAKNATGSRHSARVVREYVAVTTAGAQ